MSDDLKFSDFTLGEKAHLTALHLRMGKRGVAGPNVDLTDLKRKVERIERQALRRKQQK
jgi:hypothetical protein